VHLNVPLREPLVPDGSDAWVEPLAVADSLTSADPLAMADPLAVAGAGRSSWPDPVDTERPRRGGPGDTGEVTLLAQGPRTVVIAGDGSPLDARWVAEAAAWPLLAEPTSGARFGPNALGAYRLVLDELADDIERVVVFGRPTLARPVTRLLTREDVEMVLVRGPGALPTLGRTDVLVTEAVAPEWAVPAAPRAQPDPWLQRWLDADG
jgi:2-succinyl-5-enolpyruvyl-6-hydroxy-3-cyclohexene-1-carboxylate synthase